MKGKAAVALFIVIFLLAAAVIGTALAERDAVQTPPVEPPSLPSAPVEPVTPATPDPYQEPQPELPAAPTQEPVSVPTPAPTAEPTPPPTPEPTPEPIYVDASLGSGSFRSDTGVGLNLKADWSARTAGTDQAEVTVTISVDSYSLHLQAVPGAVNVNLAGQYVTLDAPELDYDGSAAINTVLASKTFTVNLAAGETRELFLEAVWNFGGTYQGEELPAIECGGSFTLSR